MKNKVMAFTVLFLFSMNANAEIAVGDTFVLWAGFGNFLGMSGGYIEGTEVLDSSLVKGDTSVYFFSCIKTTAYQFWEGTPQRLPGLSMQSKMTILNKTPSTIASSSVRFRNATWIIGEKSDFLFYPALKNASPYWSIPINTTDSAFLPSDYYTVRVSDTTGIKWCRDPSDDHLFNGKFLQFNDRFDTIGKYDPDSLKYSSFNGPPSWRAIGGYMSGDINPFHVLYVATSSTIPPLQADSLTIEQGLYSNQITYYRPKQTVGAVIPPPAKSPVYNWKVVGLYDVLGREMRGFSQPKSSNIFIIKKTAAINSTMKYELKFKN